MFSTRLDNFLPFLSNLKLSSANSFSLEESKMCRLVVGLVITNDKNVDFHMFVLEFNIISTAKVIPWQSWLSQPSIDKTFFFKLTPTFLTCTNNVDLKRTI